MVNSAFSTLSRARSKRAHFLGTSILVTMLAGAAAGQDVWDGGTGTWNAAPGNWNGGGAFTFGNSAQFDGPTPYTVTVDNGGTTITVDSLIFTAGGITLDGAATESLSVAGTIQVAAGQTVTQEVDIVGTAEIAGPGEYVIANGGSIGGTTNVSGGELSLATGGSIGGGLSLTGGNATIDGGASVAGTTTITNGTSLTLTDGTVQNLNLSSAGTLTLGASGTVNGTFDTNAANFTYDNGALNDDVENSGTFTVVGNRTVGGNFTNETGATLTDGGAGGNETLTVSGGTFLNDGDIESTGVLTIDSGNSILQSNSTLNGANDLDGSVVFGGDLRTQTALDVTSDFELNGRLTVQAPLSVEAELDSNGFTIDNENTLSVTATGSVVGGGNLDNTGTMDIADGASAAFDEVDNSEVGTSLTVDGTLTATGGVDNFDNAALEVNDTARIVGNVTNRDGAVLDLFGDIVPGGVGDIDGTVTNSATFNMSDASVGEVINNAGGDFTNFGNSEIDGNLTNSGAGATTIIDTGELIVQGGTTTNENNALMTVETGGDLISTNVTNQTGASLFVDNGAVTGAVANSATLDILNSTVGDVANSAGGSVEIDGASTITNNLSSTGTGSTVAIGSGLLSVDGGTVTNEDESDLSVASGATMVATTVTNQTDATMTVDGSVEAEVTNSATLDLNNGNINGVTNQGGGTFTSTGSSTILNTLTNTGTGSTASIDTGTLDVQGDAVFNENEAEMTIASGATLDSAEVTNRVDATMTVEGTVTGTLTNRNGGTLNIDGGEVTNVETGTDGITNVLSGGATAEDFRNSGTVVVDGGTLEVAAGGSPVTTINRDDGTMSVINGGEITNDVFNEGTLALNDGTLGSLTVTDLDAVAPTERGTFTSDGVSAITGDMSNAGDATVSTGVLTVGGEVNNSSGGILTIENEVGTPGQAALATGLVRNLDGGQVTLDGRITGELRNFGDLDMNGGRVDILSNRETGVTDVTGGGRVETELFNSGTFRLNSGLLSVDSSDSVNNEDGTMVIADGATLMSNLTNRGALDLLGTLDGDLDNFGALNFGGTITGGFTNRDGAVATIDGAVSSGALINESGATLDFADGDTNDSLAVTGDAVLNGTVQLDVDFGTSQSDVITATGAITGNVSLEFDLDFTDVSGGNINLIRPDAGAGPDLTYTINGSTADFIETGTVFDYNVVTGPGGSLTLESTVGTGIQNISAVAGLTQSLIGTVINRPTSPYVSGFDPFGGEPCGQGVWARGTGGAADADGQFSEVGSTISRDVPLSLNYRGFQMGTDFACFDAVNGGWDLAFGGIAGLNDGDTKGGSGISQTSTEFTQKYAGLYMVASKGRFLADLQYRVEETDFTAGNSGLGTLFESPSRYSSDAKTLSGSVAYAFPIRTGLQAATNLGFAFTDSSTDEITVDASADGSVQIEDHMTKIGFVGATLTSLRENRDGQSAIAFFANATYYHDFSDPIDGSFTTGGSAEPFEVNTLGDYGEISLGVNYTRLLDNGQLGRGRQLDAGVRLDARRGSNLDSWGITGQIRIQF